MWEKERKYLIISMPGLDPGLLILKLLYHRPIAIPSALGPMSVTKIKALLLMLIF